MRALSDLMLAAAILLIAFAAWLPGALGGVGAVFLWLGLLMRLPQFVRFGNQGALVGVRPRLRAAERIRFPSLWQRSLPWAALGLLLLAMSGGLQPLPQFLVTSLTSVMVGSALAIPAVLELFSRGGTRSRALLASQLAGMLRMGTPLPEAVEQLASEARAAFNTRYEALPTVLAYLAQDLRAGAQLSFGLACQEFFPPFWAALVGLGERGSNLSQVLEEISELEQLRKHRFNPLRTLLLLPLLGVVGWLLQSQSILPVYTRLREYFPFSTSLSQGAWGLAQLLLWMPLLGALLLRFRPSWLLELSLRVPRLSEVVLWEQRALTALALLAAARLGRPVAEMLRLAATVVTHPSYRLALTPTPALQGSSLQKCLAAHGRLFGSELLWLVGQGEASEDLVGALELAVGYLRERRGEAEVRLALGVSLALQLVAALVVLFYLLSFWLPVSGVYGQLIEESVL